MKEKIMNKQPLKITKMGLFATPKSADEIVKWIEGHSPGEKAALYVVMGMTWNFLSELAEAHKDFAE